MVHIEYVLIVVTVIRIAFSDKCEKLSSCKCECPEGIIDFSSLGMSGNGPRYKDVLAPDGYQYSYNPCDPFSETKPSVYENHCQNVAACQIIFINGVYQFYDTGVQNSVTFSTVPGTSLGIQDHPGNVVVAKYTSADGARQTEVALVCNPQNEQTAFDTLGEVASAKPLYRHILVSPFACFESGALSAGSIMLIIFFSLLLAYFLFGVTFNRFGRNQTGSDVIPQKAFWISLPTLVKDGSLFVVTRGQHKPYAAV
ncbi:cation-dependent mannose-6-phosphate receptor-like [Dreissena polymorpha]|uniref:Cation-dependent mannose-6-phosphate receptor n=1 Tax=Dreissena polymorpha TaxID=45954 RepID=A0A9D4HJY2_DREPO|nr:cation-dependent mannose-6-phosphate receptor-like [Dreissena polymorpha]KAH3720319.1 hypothetical protein DPMN_063216 [Dreissena polymorpha]